MTMERKIGEIFEYNGEWYQCVEGKCKDCHFSEKRYLCKQFIVKNVCLSGIIFKKLEKVGEPFERNGYMYQEYKAHTYPLLMSGDAKISTNNGFAVIIKQTKEDMEENKLNLKPFNLQKAKEGKPVCTKNGKKARVICFDAKGVLPIIALVESGDEEKTVRYSNSGRFRFDGIPDEEDLIMLPEKKEGWINIYKGGLLDTKSYSSKEEAISKASQTDYIDTIKIEWEE